MISCPECGQTAPDDAKFCERCGQGLAKSAATESECALAALAPGTVLHGEFRIVELAARTAVENRYRAERISEAASAEVQLRERNGSASTDAVRELVNEAAPEEGDPSGPRAKTRELKPLASEEPATLPETRPSAARSGAEAAASAGDDRRAEAASDNNGAADNVGEASVELHAGDRGAGAADGANDEVVEVSAAEETSAATVPLTLTESMVEDEPGPDVSEAEAPTGDGGTAESATAPRAELGELFERVLALSRNVNHPAFHRAIDGFTEDGRVYLVYPDERMTPLAQRRDGLRMREGEALTVAIQVCQAVSFLNRRALRLNDICPQSVAYAPGGRVKLLGLDYVSNDTELQTEPILNDGYTAPEIYRGKRVDKRADVFSVGALLYTCLTGERLECESWREEAGPIRFYPPHVIAPELEQAVRRALVFDPQGRWPTVDALKEELVRLGASVRIRAAALTDVGMVREHNEDAVMAAEYVRQSLVEPAQSYLYVVADGMGGAEAGEIASAIAVEAIRNYVDNGLANAKAENPEELVISALEEANRKILEYQTAHPESRGMGSTAVCALVVPPEVAVAWVGDSRAYLRESSGLRQLTRDHSLVQRLIEIGQITAEEARHHEHKNVITRSLGARQSGPAGAQAARIRLKRGDRLMLCSDGLTAHVDDRAIGDVLRRHDDPYSAARELVVAANAGGGTDNVSVIVVFAD